MGHLKALCSQEQECYLFVIVKSRLHAHIAHVSLCVYTTAGNGHKMKEDIVQKRRKEGRKEGRGEGRKEGRGKNNHDCLF